LAKVVAFWQDYRFGLQADHARVINAFIVLYCIVVSPECENKPFQMKFGMLAEIMGLLSPSRVQNWTPIGEDGVNRHAAGFAAARSFAYGFWVENVIGLDKV